MNILNFLLLIIVISTTNVFASHSSRLAEQRKLKYAVKQEQREEMYAQQKEMSCAVVAILRQFELSYKEKLANAARIVEGFRLRKNKSWHELGAVISDGRRSSVQYVEEREAQEIQLPRQRQIQLQQLSEAKELLNIARTSSNTVPAGDVAQLSGRCSNHTIVTQSDFSDNVRNMRLEFKEEDPYEI